MRAKGLFGIALRNLKVLLAHRKLCTAKICLFGKKL